MAAHVPRPAMLLGMKHGIARYRGAFLTIALLSAVLNLLMLGGSLYMMLIYDSALPSRSLPTLIGLFAMLLALYGFQAAFDIMRSRLLGHAAASLTRSLARPVQEAVWEQARCGARLSDDNRGAMRDLEAVRSFLAGPGPVTLMDLPWILFFVGVLMLVHVWIGLATLAGGTALMALTWVANMVTSASSERTGRLIAARNALENASLRHAETLTAMGMRERLLDRWERMNLSCLAAQSEVAQSVNRLGAIGRVGRMLVQSLILTVGAWLVIGGQASAGVIFASSMLAARALAPIDQAIANWRSLVAARQGARRLRLMLERLPPQSETGVQLPAPERDLIVEQMVLLSPSDQRVIVHGADFSLQAGDCLAVIGPSGAGKSSLGRALAGIWTPARGAVRLDDARLDQWPQDRLGRHIGYLPQSLGLLEGTVGANIARFEENARSEAIIAAARAAGVHDLVLSLPQGYETTVAADGRNLSQGQQQRIALARALYGDPFLLVLDEPNSNLDLEGDRALEQAIALVRLRGGIAVVIAHRPSATAGANKIAFLRDGRMEGFGPRDEMMRRFTAHPPSGGEVKQGFVSMRSPDADRLSSGKRTQA